MMERIIPPCRKCGKSRDKDTYGSICEDCYADIPHMPSAIICGVYISGMGRLGQLPEVGSDRRRKPFHPREDTR